MVSIWRLLSGVTARLTAAAATTATAAAAAAIARNLLQFASQPPPRSFHTTWAGGMFLVFTTDVLLPKSLKSTEAASEKS